jgi:hypothetical protein
MALAGAEQDRVDDHEYLVGDPVFEQRRGERGAARDNESRTVA